MQAQLDLFSNHLPQKSRSCDNFDVDNKVRCITEAIKKRYIQPNDFNSTQWLVFDIDRSVSPDSIRNDNLAPEPTIFVNNPKNGHAHLFYLLKTPVHQNSHSSQKAVQFAAAVEYGLATKLDADMSYVGMLAKNALHADWEVLHTIPQAYELHELAESVDTTLLNKPLKERLNYGLSRNCSMFEEVSKWAYKAIRQGWPDYNQWHEAVLARTEMLNRKLEKPLEYNEYKHIAKSITKWTHAKFSKQGFAEWQSNNGKRSGKVRAKKNDDKRMQAMQMRSNGLTQQAISDTLNVSKMTICRWLKSSL
jgi:hypothetical protein